jgi:hypothetical protein
MKIRLECTLPELAANWVDLSDVWTRGEVRDWYAGSLASKETVTLPLLEKKLVGVHLHLADGTLVTDAATLFARLDDMDMRLVRWLGVSVMAALQENLALGEAQRRLLFDGVEIAAVKTPTTPR